MIRDLLPAMHSLASPGRTHRHTDRQTDRRLRRVPHPKQIGLRRSSRVAVAVVSTGMQRWSGACVRRLLLLLLRLKYETAPPHASRARHGAAPAGRGRRRGTSEQEHQIPPAGRRLFRPAPQRVRPGHTDSTGAHRRRSGCRAGASGRRPPTSPSARTAISPRAPATDRLSLTAGPPLCSSLWPALCCAMTHPPQDNPTRKKASWILRKFRRSSAAHETASSAAAATATATATTTANAANNAPALTPAHTPAHTPSHTPNHTPSHTPDPAPPSHIPPSASDHCRRSAPSSFTPVPPPPEPNSRSSRPDSASSSGSRPSSGPGHAPAMTGAAIGTTTTGTAARTRPASGPSRRPSSRLATSHAGSRSTPQPQPEPPASSRFRGKQRAVDPPEHAHASIPPSLLSHPPLPRRVQVPDARDRPLPAYRSSWDSASSRSTAAASGGGDRPPLRPAPIANGSLWRPQSMLSISSTSVTHGAGRGPSGSKPLQSSFPAPSRILWFDHDHDHHQGQDHDHDDPDFPRLRPRSLSLSLPRLDNSPSTEHDALETNSLFSDRSPSRASTKPTTLISFDPAPSTRPSPHTPVSYLREQLSLCFRGVAWLV